ncbi:MAG TPA: hypothetical protein VER33_08110 [Polyangiaceae bacterium]|nr:hypothetical protein [Polyangiaceae bacterium]
MQALQQQPAVAHVVILCSAAVAIVTLALVSGAGETAEVGTLALGGLAALTLAHFGWLRRKRARRGLRLREMAPGRIREASTPASVVFRFPGDGIEPWGADAWIVLLTALAAVSLSRLLHGAHVALLGFVAAQCGALALRLRSARSDCIQIEIGSEGFIVEGLEAGRPIHRAGHGPLYPVLRPDALSLWSGSGRIAVLACELEPEERLWLADRLETLALRSAAEHERGHVDESQSEQDRQRQQREQTDESHG